MPTRGSKDPNGRALRGRRAHTTFALLSDPVRQIWDSFNNRANAGGADAPEAAVNGCLYDRFKSLYTKTATKPSLVIVPARFKSGTLYSQIPSSNADFTVTRPLNTATRFDSSALIQAGITSGVPRLDYYTSGGVTGCPALLVEPAATNTFIESQTLFTAHLPINLTTSGYTNAATSPDGSVTAEKFVPNTNSGVHGIANVSFLAITSGTTYTLSLFVKSDGGPYNLISLTFDSTTAWGATRNCIFNASNGTNFSVPSGATMTSENYGNGWYRIRATLTAVGTVAANQYQYRIYVTNASGNISWTAPSGNTNGIFCWGAQLETGSVATSYIPTTAGSVTRNADVISVSGAVSGSIGQTEGTIYAEVDVRTFASSAARRIVNLRVDGSNLLSLEINAASTNIEFVATSGGVSVNAVASGLTAGITKIAVGYNSAASGTVLYVNGTLRDTKTIAIPNLSAAVFGLGVRGDGGADTQLNDRIRAVALYTTRLTNDELQSLTQT